MEFLASITSKNGTVRRRFMALALILLSSPSQAFDLEGTAWATAANERGIDPEMLYAIALTESGRDDGKGRIKPWPWALNVNGQAIFALSKKKAIDLLASHRGQSIDVGLLQVNTKWHGHRVSDLTTLLDPQTNVSVGAAILRDALASAPGDLTTGIGRYHSRDPERGQRYARTVLSIYRQLKHASEGGNDNE